MSTTSQALDAATRLDRNRELVRRWFDEGMHQPTAAAARAVSAELFADGFVDHDGSGTATRDRAAWQCAVLDAVFAGFSDIEVRIERLLAQDDLVAVRYLFRGRHTSPFLGRPATGRSIQHTENEIFRIAGGRIAESWGEGTGSARCASSTHPWRRGVRSDGPSRSLSGAGGWPLGAGDGAGAPCVPP